MSEDTILAEIILVFRGCLAETGVFEEWGQGFLFFKEGFGLDPCIFAFICLVEDALG
jgi:hypothetical protein